MAAEMGMIKLSTGKTTLFIMINKSLEDFKSLEYKKIIVSFHISLLKNLMQIVFVPSSFLAFFTGSCGHYLYTLSG